MVLERATKTIEEKLGLPSLKDIAELREIIPMMETLVKTVVKMPEPRLKQVREILELVRDIKGGEEELRLVHDLVRELASAPKERIADIRGLIRDLAKAAKDLPRDLIKDLTKS